MWCPYSSMWPSWSSMRSPCEFNLQSDKNCGLSSLCVDGPPKITKKRSLALFVWLEPSQAFFYQDEGSKRQERVRTQPPSNGRLCDSRFSARMLYLTQINLLPSIIYYTDWMPPNP